MDSLQKKIDKARRQRTEGTRVEVAPRMTDSALHDLLTKVTGLEPDDRWAVVTCMGPKGCQLQSEEMAGMVICAGSRKMCDEVFEEMHKHGANGEAFPFELAVVRQNRWFKIPFDVGPLTDITYHEEEVQYIWDQRAGDVDLLTGVQGATREGVRRYFAGFQ